VEGAVAWVHCEALQRASALESWNLTTTTTLKKNLEKIKSQQSHHKIRSLQQHPPLYQMLPGKKGNTSGPDRY
jgi:hypothetical protein